MTSQPDGDNEAVIKSASTSRSPFRHSDGHHDQFGRTPLDTERQRLKLGTVVACGSVSSSIELQVIHDPHCLNMLHKVDYPDEYSEMFVKNEYGRADHDSLIGLHIGKFPNSSFPA